jgi:hypothetical protein
MPPRKNPKQLLKREKPYPENGIRLPTSEKTSIGVGFFHDLLCRFPSPVLTVAGSKGWENPLSGNRTPSVHRILTPWEIKSSLLSRKLIILVLTPTPKICFPFKSRT